jgi:hypothetical protein
MAQAASIVGAIIMTWVALSAIARQVTSGSTEPRAGSLGSFLGVPLVVVSLGILAAVLAAAECAAHFIKARPTPTDPPVRTRRS